LLVQLANAIFIFRIKTYYKPSKYNKKMKTLPFLCTALVLIFFSQQCVYSYDKQISEAAIPNKKFSIDLDKKEREINPLFWGTNFLFWIEDDAALADGKIERSLKELPVKSLRYPGGTVADNFHWKTNSLSNKYRFPYEEGETETDFDEFMSFCNRINAQPVLVVNTESWQIAKNIKGGIQEAVEWVKYCKERGYKVKYWEIGNETYWNPFFTAREYGQIVKEYALAMKAVDPTIKISANGPWDIHITGTKERTDPTQWETIRKMYENISSREATEVAESYAKSYRNTNIMSGEEKWWYNVAEECGQYIDMISIHWYFKAGNKMEYMDDNIEQIKQLFKSKFPDRDYIVCMTEYNCNNENSRLAISGLFEGISRFLMAGVEIANFWPLRNSINGNRKSMLHLKTKQVGYPYQILQLLGNNLKGDLLKVNSENRGIFPIATYNGKQLTVLVNGSAVVKPIRVTMYLSEMELFTLYDSKSYEAPESDNVPIQLKVQDIDVELSASACSFEMMPAQTVLLRFIIKDSK
jgi:hypothetical protein